MADAPPSFPDLAELERDGFGWWFAGLVDGEGCLTVVRRTSTHGVSCQLRIRLRDDDAACLELVQSRLRCGRLYYDQPDKGEPQVCWTVQAKAECRYLVAVMDRYRGFGKKSLQDYPLWREAVLLCTTPAPPGRDWTELYTLSDRLSAVKVYDESVTADKRTRPRRPLAGQPQRLWCVCGQHQWEREFRRGRPPLTCPEHRTVHGAPVELYCETGEHSWLHPKQVGPRPRNCSDHR